MFIELSELVTSFSLANYRSTTKFCYNHLHENTGSQCYCSSSWRNVQAAVAPTSRFDHLGAVVSCSQVVLFVVTICVLAFTAFTFPRLLAPRPIPITTILRELRERTYSFSYRPLQELFSKGILHPKVF